MAASEQSASRRATTNEIRLAKQMDQLYRDTKKIEFDGEDSSLLSSYLDELELLRATYEDLLDTELHERDLVKNTVKGHARRWFISGHYKTWTTWDAFVTEIKARYGPNEEELIRQFEALSYNEGDDPIVYCETYQRLVLELEYETQGRQAVNTFLRKINGLWIRQLVKTKEPTTLAEACKWLQQLQWSHIHLLRQASQRADHGQYHRLQQLRTEHQLGHAS
jgi:hypothetical protein